MGPEGSLPCSQTPATGPYPVRPIFSCLGRAKESVRVRGALKHFVTNYFFKVRCCSPTPNPQARGPPLVICARLLVQYILSYPSYLEAFSSIRNLRTRHAVKTCDNVHDKVRNEGKASSFLHLFNDLFLPYMSFCIAF
jgi:hypothetical protein